MSQSVHKRFSTHSPASHVIVSISWTGIEDRINSPWRAIVFSLISLLLCSSQAAPSALATSSGKSSMLRQLSSCPLSIVNPNKMLQELPRNVMSESSDETSISEKVRTDTSRRKMAVTSGSPSKSQIRPWKRHSAKTNPRYTTFFKKISRPTVTLWHSLLNEMPIHVFASLHPPNSCITQLDSLPEYRSWTSMQKSPAHRCTQTFSHIPTPWCTMMCHDNMTQHLQKVATAQHLTILDIKPHLGDKNRQDSAKCRAKLKWQTSGILQHSA